MHDSHLTLLRRGEKPRQKRPFFAGLDRKNGRADAALSRGRRAEQNFSAYGFRFSGLKRVALIQNPIYNGLIFSEFTIIHNLRLGW